MISTNELFHYTKSKDGLIGIISNGFFPNYNLEYSYNSDLFERPAIFVLIPMVCFCDIPLNLVNEHSNKYGRYAIALKKDWANKNGLNPVIYVNSNSVIGDAFSVISNSISNYKSNMISKDSDIKVFPLISNIFKGFQHLSYFVKQVERENDEIINLFGNQIVFPKMKFYNEREWRYIPIWNEQGQFKHITHEDYFNKEKMKLHNSEMINSKLEFEFNDITHIIYNQKSDLDDIIDSIIRRFNVDDQLIWRQIKIVEMSSL